jgi:hypothetical protein
VDGGEGGVVEADEGEVVGDADAAFAPAAAEGGGWAAFDITMAGDVTSDGRPDLIACDNRTGIPYLYRGNGAGSYTSSVVIGTGWGGMNPVL